MEQPPSAPTEQSAPPSLPRRVRDGIAYVAQPRHLARTVPLAVAVGLVLTAINQLDVIVRGDATAGTWVKCGLNFLVPFCVANLGLLTGRRELRP